MDLKSKLRLLYIAKILYDETDENHFLTTNQIADILKDRYGIETHRQTVKSEIQLLVEFGLDIQEVRSVQNRYNIISRAFEIAELKLLIDAVESSKFISGKNSKALVEKLSNLAGIYGAEQLRRNVSCERRIKSDNNKIYIIIDAINEAINQKKKISFKYFQYDRDKKHKLKNSGKPYTITPLHLVWNGDYYYMVGVYDYKQRTGSFRVDRISDVPVMLDEEATSPPESFDINDYINSTFRMFSGKPTDVILECDNNVMDSIIDRFGENVEVIRNDDKCFDIRINVVANHVLYSWIFGFGGKVKIKSPDYIQNAYLNMLEDAVASIRST